MGGGGGGGGGGGKVVVVVVAVAVVVKWWWWWCGGRVNVRLAKQGTPARRVREYQLAPCSHRAMRHEPPFIVGGMSAVLLP